MSGDPRIIEVLVSHARDELTAIVQYVAHAEQATRRGLPGLHAWLHELAEQEMRHLARLAARIYRLGGVPDWSPAMPPLQEGGPVDGHRQDLSLEHEAIGALRLSVELAEQTRDQETGRLLREILADEERHADLLDARLAAVETVGEDNYLSQYLAGA